MPMDDGLDPIIRLTGLRILNMQVQKNLPKFFLKKGIVITYFSGSINRKD